MPLFRKGRGPHALALAMVGLKLGDRFLQIGCEEADLLATLAGRSGLSGTAVAIDARPDMVEKALAAAARGGVLVDARQSALNELPLESDSFDVAVVDGAFIASLEPARRRACLHEVRRVLRPGGRCVAIERLPRGGLAALFDRQSPQAHPAATESALSEEGFRAVRVLGEAEGQRFVEAVKG
jgi:ubiquinone/menaquinone biosynthesis C-methylase UbiE